MATINIGNLTFTHRGDYDGSTAYAKNDVVYYSTNGNAYIAKQATTGNAPTNATYWSQFAAGSGGIYDGSLSIGSANQILRVNSGATALEFADPSGGALVKLASTKVSGGAVSNITFNSSVLDTSTYKKFKFFIHIYGTVGGSSIKLLCKPSKDNGSNYNLNAFSSGIGAYVQYDGTNNGDYRINMIDAGNNRWLLGGAVSGNGTGNQSVHWIGEGNLYNCNDTSTYSQTSHFVWQGGRYYTSTGSDLHTMYQAGQGMAYGLGTGTPVNAIQFYWSSGNVQNDSRISVYGVKED